MSNIPTSSTLEMRRFVSKLKTDVIPALQNNYCSEDEANTRGLTALVLTQVGGMLLSDSPQYVTDSVNDLGIDGLFYNRATKTLYIIQSKFRINQNKTIDQGEVHKFIYGVRKLINADIAESSSKLQSAFAAIQEALEPNPKRVERFQRVVIPSGLQTGRSRRCLGLKPLAASIGGICRAMQAT